MPSVSQAQHNLMQAVAHNPKFAKKVGIAQSVGRDFAAADRGRFAEGGRVEDDSWLWDANASSDGLDNPMAGGGRVEKPKTFKLAGKEHEALPLKPMEDATASYMQFIGRPNEQLRDYPAFDEDRARKIGQAYEDMQHAPNDPRVKRAYDAMIDETLAQYRRLPPYEFSFLKPGEGDPYAHSPAQGYLDLRDNGRLRVFPTDAGFGTLGELDVSSNPLLKRVGKIGDLDNATANDAFRIVHDMYGHFGPGNPFFRHKGEERAWLHHKDMYSPEAVPAMTSETRGQNSWLNFGPYGERNRNASSADTVYADQKTGLLPEFAWQDYKDGGRVTPKRNIEWRDDFDTMFGGQSRAAGDLVRRHTEKTGKEGASLGNEFFHTPLIRGERTSVDLSAGKIPFGAFSQQMEQQKMPYFSVHAHPVIDAGYKELTPREAANVMSSGHMLGGPLFPSTPDLGFVKPLHSMFIESAGLPNNRLMVGPSTLEDVRRGRELLSHTHALADAGMPLFDHNASPKVLEYFKGNNLSVHDPLPLDLLLDDALAARGVPISLDRRAATGTMGGPSIPAMDLLPDFKGYLDRHDIAPYR